MSAGVAHLALFILTLLYSASPPSSRGSRSRGADTLVLEYRSVGSLEKQMLAY